MYDFDVSYPLTSDDEQLWRKQVDILNRFPECTTASCPPFKTPHYKSTTYIAKKPGDIARVASALKNADPRLIIGFVQNNGESIYFHPAFLNSEDRVSYLNILKHLHAPDRVLHDYLVNLYGGVPT